MATIQLIPEVDFDRNGTYETDLSAYFNERAGGLVIGRGASNQGVLSPGTMTLNLDNFDGTFTLDYSSSSLYGQLEPHVPIRCRLRINGTDYVLFTGYVSRYRPKFGAVGENRCSIEAKDLSAHLANFPLVNVQVAERETGAAIEAIADALGIASVVDSDSGLETLPVHWCHNANALDAMMDVVRSEMGGELFINGDGEIRYLQRDARLGTYDIADEWGTGSTIEPESVDPELTDDDLITSCAVQASVFVDDDPNVVIYTFSRGASNPTPDSLFLAANVPYDVDLDFPMPVESVVTPVEDTDYSANSAIDGTGTDQSGSLTVTVTLQGAGFHLRLLSSVDSYLTRFQLRGLPTNFAIDKPVFTHTLSIPGQIMDQGVTLQVPFAEDSQTTRDYPVAVCRTYRYPYTLTKLSFAWDTDDIAVAMASLELWDHVYFADTGPGGAEFLTNIADHFYVVGIQHRITPGSVIRTDVTMVPSYLYFNLDAVVTDDFDRANATGVLGTALSGDVWSGDGSMDIVSGAARASSDSAQTPTLLLFEADDQVVEVQLSEIGTGDEVGVVFRYEDANNYSRVYVDEDSNEVIHEHVKAGVSTEISSPAYTVGTSAEIRVIIQDHRVRAWVNRRLYIDNTDTTMWLGNRVGLFARNASGTTKFSNFHGRGI